MIGSFLALSAVKASERKVQVKKEKHQNQKRKKIPKKQSQDIRECFKSAEMNGDNDDDGEVNRKISQKTHQMSQL